MSPWKHHLLKLGGIELENNLSMLPAWYGWDVDMFDFTFFI